MTYQEIAKAAKAYADRNDLEVADNMDTFFIMAEARINRVLKTREQTTRTYTPFIDGEEYYGLPSDYAGMRDIQCNSDVPSSPHSSAPFNYINPEQFNIKRNESYAGKLYYSIIANQIQIFPTQANGVLEIVYYQKVPNLNETESSNWLSAAHPDIYLAGVLAEIESFVKNYEVSKSWDAKMSRSIKELDNSDVIERWSGAPLTVKVG